MAEFKSDIEIARAARKRPIGEIGEKLGIPGEHLLPYGHDKAKVSADFIESLADRPDGKLILVTAISPTPAGEGKTTTTVGLGDGLSAIGKKTAICLREPSLGPNFGIKGGAAGGGRAQVVPMEDINLHFTGDFHAIGAQARIENVDRHLDALVRRGGIRLPVIGDQAADRIGSCHRKIVERVERRAPEIWVHAADILLDDTGFGVAARFGLAA